MLNGNESFALFSNPTQFVFVAIFALNSHGVQLNLTWIADWKMLLFCNCILQVRTRILSEWTHTEIISRSLDPSSLWHKLRLLISYFRYLSENTLTNLPRELFDNLTALKKLWVRSLWFVLNGNESFALFPNTNRIFCVAIFGLVTVSN